MTLPLDSIICGDNVQVLRAFPDECIDLTVTSPPYDNLRQYGGHSWDFEGVAQELWRVTKPGGVVVWVVGDATVNGSETGTSFRQALHFMSLGFKLHDTMIYRKNNPVPQYKVGRYYQAFEYMFVLAKGGKRECNYLTEPCDWAGSRPHSGKGGRLPDGTFLPHGSAKATRDTKIRGNVWGYGVGFGQTTTDTEAYQHPAIFPDKLAEDHILSWSNEGNVVLDPFSGSGTTAKMAAAHGRRFIGIEVNEEYCDIARGRLQNVQSTLEA